MRGGARAAPERGPAPAPLRSAPVRGAAAAAGGGAAALRGAVRFKVVGRRWWRPPVPRPGRPGNVRKIRPRNGESLGNSTPHPPFPASTPRLVLPGESCSSTEGGA